MEIILFGLLAVLLVFMFFNTRKRQRQMKAEQEEKATKTVPGAKVLLQGGLYGKIVAYDPEDLDSPALVEIAPGTVIEVHSQAILRVVEPLDAVADANLTADTHESVIEESTPDATLETPEQTRARLERDADDK
ncbi:MULTISPECIES: preprotein translocase subunit YajC [unclassified Microbacterium]|uniref:preprotein translocase subunit YajC n=1 Tax=unclassified Microbacterium TaxID=2609290 RepID=UPI002BDC226A|nr:preprotein translocase subunit YajC [Microbacterium sp.]HWK76175.1 preprotein translocase subunit YajC [Microbacterium sp.]